MLSILHHCHDVPLSLRFSTCRYIVKYIQAFEGGVKPYLTKVEIRRGVSACSKSEIQGFNMYVQTFKVSMIRETQLEIEVLHGTVTVDAFPEALAPSYNLRRLSQ